MFWKRKQRHIMPPYVIDDETALHYIRQEKSGTLDHDGAAMLEVWRFYRRPTKRYQFLIDKPLNYAFSDYWDRLGKLNLTASGVYVYGDSGITYYTRNENLILPTRRKHGTITATAHFSRWQDIETAWYTPDDEKADEKIPIESLTPEQFAAIVGNRNKARQRRKKF